MNKRFVKTITSLAVASLLVGAVPTLALAADTAVTTTSATAEATAEKSIVHFVNASKPGSLSSMVTYIANPSVYEKDGVNYLRIDVQQVYDVTITVEGKEGVKVAEYEKTVVGRNGEENVTYFTFDYALTDITKAIEASASYFVPAYFTEPQSHDIYVMINNDIDASIKELATVLAEAKQIAEPSKELAAAITAAEAANSYLTKKADLEAVLKQLKVAFYAEPVAVPVHYVNDADTSKLSSMGTYLANPRTYVKDDVKYFRVDVQQSYDVKVTVEGKEGNKVGEYKATINGRTGPQEVTFYTLDYVVSSFDDVLEAAASYFVPGVFTETQSHNIKLVIGENVESSKAKLVKAIAAANAAVVEPSSALLAAIEEANKSNSYLLTNAQIQAATDALVAATAKEVSLSDISSHWGEEAIVKAVASGIASGYPDGSFAPDQSITRAEFTKLLVEGLGLTASNVELSFTDAESVPEWAQTYVKSAVAAGIINGYSDGSFRPNGEINRAEMAVMIVKALGLELEAAESLSFSDNEGIPAFAKQQVATAVKHGLVQGLSNNKFGADQSASRAQAVTIILRALEN